MITFEYQRTNLQLFKKAEICQVMTSETEATKHPHSLRKCQIEINLRR